MTSLNKIPRGVTSTVGKVFAAWLNDVQRVMNIKISELTTAIESHIVVFDNSGGIQDSGKGLPSGDVVGTSDAQALSNKTLSIPTIADFSNATHDHTDSQGGGTVRHDSLTNLSNDDHTQYLTESRGDARFLNKANLTIYTPADDYNPATKKYVDDNSGVSDHGALTGLGDDDHSTVYIAKNSIAAYTPTAPTHPATKGYVDNKKSATQGDASTASGDPADLTAAVTKTDFNSAVSVINSLIDKLQAGGLMT